MSNNVVGIGRFCKSMVNFDMWPTYKGGNLQRFNCTRSLGLLEGSEWNS